MASERDFAGNGTRFSGICVQPHHLKAQVEETVKSREKKTSETNVNALKTHTEKAQKKKKNQGDLKRKTTTEEIAVPPKK